MNETERVLMCVFRNLSDKGKKALLYRVLKTVIRDTLKHMKITRAEQLWGRGEGAISDFLGNQIGLVPYTISYLKRKENLTEADMHDLNKTIDLFARVGTKLLLNKSVLSVGDLYKYLTNPGAQERGAIKIYDMLMLELSRMVEKITSNRKYDEIIEEINSLINQQIMYGTRVETTKAPYNCVIAWSNAAEMWHITHPAVVTSAPTQSGKIEYIEYHWLDYPLRAGVKVRLDANEVLAPYPCKMVKPVVCLLMPLPLYANSFEFEQRYVHPDDWEEVSKNWAIGWYAKYMKDFMDTLNGGGNV